MIGGCRKTVTLRGDNIAEEFRRIVDEYVETTYAPRRDATGVNGGG